MSKSILEDSVVVEPVLDCKRYSQSIAKLIRNSDHKFSIGIYGEWGTGKTTLMKLIEKAIRGYIFSWDKYRVYNEEGLIEFLKENVNSSWTKNNVEIKTSNQSVIISKFSSSNADKKSRDSTKIKISNEKALKQNEFMEKLAIERENGKSNAYGGSQNCLV